MTLLWSVCLFASTLTLTPAVVVNTHDGALRGITTHVGSVQVDSYYNIPFAKPPVGDLRFVRPVVNEPWTGTRDATAPGPHCVQHPYLLGMEHPTITVSGVEDCLYLNVYSPRMHGGPQPVMVWIHGGAFYMGAGIEYDGRQLASNGVVIVTVNYRLGALGFLSTQDAVSPGNYGLFDQVLALRWVRDVISAFNGDPNDVTIFGESAGSVSVSLLVQSQEAAGLFHRAIMESGGSLGPWALSLPGMAPQPRAVAASLASRLGCPVNGSGRLLDCLRAKDAHRIVEVQGYMEIENDLRMNFRPVVESTFGQAGGFLAELPETALRSGRFNNVSVVRGFTKDEDSEIAFIKEDYLSLEQFRNHTQYFVRTSVMKTYPSLNLDTTVDLLVDKYVTGPGVINQQELRHAFIQMNSDFDFYAPVLKELQLFKQANGNSQYLYCFHYRSAHRQLPAWMGVPHADELMYVFGYPLNNLTLFPNFVSAWTDDDKAVAQQVMTWWTNFAKHSNPTPGGAYPLWLPWSPAASRCLAIDRITAMVDSLSAASNPQLDFWNDVIPRMAAGGSLVG